MIVNRTGTLLAYRATYKDRDGTRTSTQNGDDRSDADLNSRLSDPASSTNTSRKRTLDSRKKSIDGRSDRDGNVTSTRRMQVATMHSLKTTPSPRSNIYIGPQVIAIIQPQKCEFLTHRRQK